METTNLALSMDSIRDIILDVCDELLIEPIEVTLWVENRFVGARLDYTTNGKFFIYRIPSCSPERLISKAICNIIHNTEATRKNK